MKPATEAQRREARKLIFEAFQAHKRAIEAKHTTPEFYPKGDEILKVLKSGKIKLRTDHKNECSCPSLHTDIGKLIDFGQRDSVRDTDAIRAADAKLEEAKAKAVAAVTLGDVAGDKLLPIVEAFRTAKF